MDVLILALRVLLSLGAVVAVVWYVQRRVTRIQRGSKAGDPVKVIARRGVGQKAAVVIVEASGKRFTLGVTEQTVNVLHTEDAPEPAPVTEPQEASADAFARAMAGAAEAPASTGARRRELQGRRVAASRPPAESPLAGSILSPGTWKQAADVIRRGIAG